MLAAPSAGHRRPVENPYKGLRAFDATDAVDFYGRERLVERLVARLGQPGTRGRFFAVVGPSGSGKSSVVKAGLLAAVRRGAAPMSGSWFTIEMTPALHPFEALEDALLSVAVDPPASLLEQLAGEHGLSRALHRVLPNDGSQLLLVIDQLEELFTHVDGPLPIASSRRSWAPSPTTGAGSVSSPRCAPTSMTVHCSTAVSVSCSATAPKSSPR